ncbi:MAG: hypothetical protein ACK56F_20075 [bacterium]
MVCRTRDRPASCRPGALGQWRPAASVLRRLASADHPRPTGGVAG